MIFAAALSLGLGYVFVVPPWMHYDEPNHFEYVYLAATRSQLPKPGDFDPAMRLAVARSELETGFFKALDLPVPNLEQVRQPVWIGPQPQLDDPALYYLWAGLPLRLFPTAGVETQLYLARCMSLILYLFTVGVVFLTAAELAPAGHPLRSLLPAGVAFLPTFVDFMTSVNNSVAEIALVSVVIWGIVRLLKGGFSWWVAGLSLACGLLTYWVKPTGLFILPFFFLALWFVVLRGRFRRLAWGAVAAALLLGVVVGLKWEDALAWNRASSQPEAARTPRSDVPLGVWAFQVNLASPLYPLWNSPFYQTFPFMPNFEAPQAEYTVGAWMWADVPASLALPRLTAARTDFTVSAEIGVIPQFYAYTVTLPLGQNIYPFHIDLRPLDYKIGKGIVYYDGIVVAPGYFPLDQAPVFRDASASQGTWAGRPFVNLVRNASAETVGPRVRHRVDVPLAQFLPNQVTPSLTLMTLFDVEGAWWFYQQTAVYDFQTFWGRFGWGALPLLGGKAVYPYFLAFTLLGLGLSLYYGLRSWRANRKDFPYELVFTLACIVLMYVGFTLVRGISFMGVNKLYYSPARYAFPAIIPIIATLLGGFSCVAATLQYRLVNRVGLWFIIQISPFWVINIWALVSIQKFMEVYK